MRSSPHWQIRPAVGCYAWWLSEAPGQRTGQEVRYALVPGPLDEVSDWIAEIGSRWDERLARLRQVVLDQNPAAQDG